MKNKTLIYLIVPPKLPIPNCLFLKVSYSLSGPWLKFVFLVWLYLILIYLHGDYLCLELCFPWPSKFSTHCSANFSSMPRLLPDPKHISPQISHLILKPPPQTTYQVWCILWTRPRLHACPLLSAFFHVVGPRDSALLHLLSTKPSDWVLPPLSFLLPPRLP